MRTEEVMQCAYQKGASIKGYACGVVMIPVHQCLMHTGEQ